MSLDWNCEKCANPLPADDEEAGIRTSLIWATMGLGLGRIAEDNVDEWVFRIYYQKRIALDFITMEESVTPSQVERWVRRWIGMWTNVKTMSRKEWLASVAKDLERDTMRELERAKRAQAASQTTTEEDE